MKKIISILSLIFLTLSCSSIKKERYKVINDFLKDENLNFVMNKITFEHFDKNDTIYIAREAFNQFEYNNFKFYDILTDGLEKTDTVSFIGWFNIDNQILLNQKEISNFGIQFQNEKNFFWEQKKISSLNKVIIPKDDVIGLNAKYNDRETKKSKKVYIISQPFFNSKKDVAIFGFKICNNSYFPSTPPSYYKLVIMKKVNEKWVYIGDIRTTKHY